MILSQELSDKQHSRCPWDVEGDGAKSQQVNNRATHFASWCCHGDRSTKAVAANNKIPEDSVGVQVRKQGL